MNVVVRHSPAPLVLSTAAAIRGNKPFSRQKGVTLLDADKDQCRYIADEPNADETIFCGAPTKSGEPYCPLHRALCWRDPGEADA